VVQPSSGPPPADDARAALERPVVRPPAEPLGKPCRCGHGKVAHQHYRPGADCALCACPRFRRVSRLAHLMGRR
jgi:hypothetical protein